MDQEKIGKFIKEIRTKEKLSQQKFADKYGVTYQAVSKWENGKNIPDISILKEMCSEYHMNLDDFLKTNIVPKKDKKKRIWISCSAVLVLIIIVIILIKMPQKDSNFEFKTLSTSCDDFNLYGSLAYNNLKSSIYISNITYCGGDDSDTYQKIECILYEDNGNTKIEIEKYHYENDEGITLENFLKDVNFHIDNYEKTCKVYKQNSLYLEIEATNQNEKIITYKIPLNLKDNCNS